MSITPAVTDSVNAVMEMPPVDATSQADVKTQGGAQVAVQVEKEVAEPGKSLGLRLVALLFPFLFYVPYEPYVELELIRVADGMTGIAFFFQTISHFYNAMTVLPEDAGEVPPPSSWLEWAVTIYYLIGVSEKVSQLFVSFTLNFYTPGHIHSHIHSQDRKSVV